MPGHDDNSHDQLCHVQFTLAERRFRVAEGDDGDTEADDSQEQFKGFFHLLTGQAVQGLDKQD